MISSTICYPVPGLLSGCRDIAKRGELCDYHYMHSQLLMKTQRVRELEMFLKVSRATVDGLMERLTKAQNKIFELEEEIIELRDI